MKKLFLIIVMFSILGVISAQTYLYWSDADANKIYRAKLDSDTSETVLIEQNTPRGITIDYEHGKLFFADGEHNSITSANLDGSNINFLNNVTEPIDLYLDKRDGFIYYSDVTEGTISKIKTDGSYNQIIISNIIKPAFLTLDIINNHIYFCSKQDSRSIIYRADLDGSNIKKIIDESGYITGVAVDPYNDKLYWLNRETAKVLSSSLDGSNKSPFANASSICIALEYDDINNKLYWAEKDNNRIQSINSDKSDMRTFMKFTKQVGGIALDIKNACTKTVEVFDTTYVSVTDTLIIDVTFTGTNNNTYNNIIKVFPNPTKDYIVIDLGDYYSKISDYSIQIINSSGQNIFKSKFNKKTIKIDIDDFAINGLYFIRFIDNLNNLFDVKKLVLE